MYVAEILIREINLANSINQASAVYTTPDKLNPIPSLRKFHATRSRVLTNITIKGTSLANRSFCMTPEQETVEESLCSFFEIVPDPYL
jgi:hypothetical protein